MTVPPGFKVTLFAGEPDVVQPISFAIDHRGRLWVAEAYSYPIRVPDADARDRILIFEDTNNDGRFDSRKVFADKLNMVSGIEVGFGGVWVGAAPNLLFIPDKDHDDKPDGPPVVLLDGWGAHDTHETLNSFAWGPDGWLYGCHGVFTHSRVGKPGTPDAERIPINAGIWRYHPTRHVFEVFAHGTSNPWGVDFDAHGQVFLTACVIPHLYHVIQGARYERQAGPHFNPYTYDDIKTIADHRHYLGANPHAGNGRSDQAGGGHAHAGALIYQGNTWPEEYRGSIFMNNIHGARINRDLLVPQGSGFVGKHAPDFLVANDRWSQIVSLKYGPDGSMFMIDWYDKNQCHHRDVNGHDRTNGRIFKVSYGKHDPVKIDLNDSTDDIACSDHGRHQPPRSERSGQRMGVAPRPSADPGAGAKRKRAGTAVLSRNSRRPLQWALTRSACARSGALHALRRALDEEKALNPVQRARSTRSSRLGHPAPRREGNTVRQDARSLRRSRQGRPVPGRSPLPRLGPSAHSDREPLGDPRRARRPRRGRRRPQPAVDGLVRRRAARHGRREPGLESRLECQAAEPAAVHGPPGRGDRLAGIDRDAREDDRRGEDRSRPPNPRGRADRGAEGASAGRHARRLAEGLARASASGDERLRSQATALALTFGDPSALTSMRTVLGDASQNLARRRDALTALAQGPRRRACPRACATCSPIPPCAAAAIRGLAEYDDPKAPDAILGVYAELAPDERRDALNTLAARVGSARALLAAVGEGRISSKDLAADVIRQLRNHKNAAIDAQIGKVWGTARETTGDRARTIARYRAMLASQPARAPDPELGRAIYAKTCQQCHTLFGVGGKIGPDLTGSNRRDLDYVLSNVLDPSALIGKDYLAHVVSMADGRVLTGLVRGEDKDALTLQTANEQVVIPLGEIDRRRPSDQSMMPEDLWTPLSEHEVRSLIAYLAGPAQVPMRATKENIAGFFNGRDLTGWVGEAGLWSVENGEIVGKTAGLKRNAFLRSEMAAADFRLSLKIKLVKNEGNSGIQFRSAALPGGEMKGYQADAGPGWWGKLYEENGRGLLWPKSGEEYVRPGEWNTYEIVAVGHSVRTRINGKPCVDLDDPAGATRGVFAFQLHSGDATEVRFKEIRLELNPVLPGK